MTSAPKAMSTTSTTHDHVFLGASHEDNAKRTLWVVLLTVVMRVGEIAAGYITGSMDWCDETFDALRPAENLGLPTTEPSPA